LRQRSLHDVERVGLVVLYASPQTSHVRETAGGGAEGALGLRSRAPKYLRAEALLFIVIHVSPSAIVPRCPTVGLMEK